MEMAYYCQQCNAANLINYDNHQFVGSCHHCAAPIQLEIDSLCVNTIIDQRYQIREEIDETQISNLYIATDLSNSNLVILRVFCWDFSYSISDTDDFLNTVDSVGAIAVPTHVELIDWGLTEDLMYTIWPCENIESLTKLLKHHTTFEPEVAISICREIAIALENIYYEAGIGHYNLSSHNIYLDGQGKTRFSDAGHAAFLFHDSNFQDAEFDIYNRHYLSPEIAYDWSTPDIRSDMYSLGCCLYAMVTGKLPFGHRGPQTEQDYANFGLSKPDEYRLGDEFCRLFYGLTEVRPDDRFQSWVDAVKVMDNYLYEEKQLKQAALSGKRRSLTTSFNFDLYAEVDEELAAPARSRAKKKKKKVLSSSDIRVRMRSSSPIKNTSRPRSHKSVTANRKKNNNQVAFIAIAALVFLGLMLFGVLIFKTSNAQLVAKKQSEAIDQSEEPPLQKSPQKEPKTQAVPPVAAKPKVVPKPVEISAEEDFKELTFEIRELALRKKWDQALALSEVYEGPYKSDMQKIQKEIEAKKRSYLEAALDAALPSKDPLETPALVGGNSTVTLNDLAERIFNGQFNLALEMIPVLEKYEKINLSMITEALEDTDPERLNGILAVNYQKEIGSKVNLVIDNKAFEGTLMEISHANSSLKIKVNYLAQKLERIYSFSLISVLDNVKRLKKENADEQSLLQFLYLLQNKKYDLALENLEKYNGVLRKEMLVSMRESQNKQAEIAWSGLLGFMKLDQSLDDNSFVESFQKLRLLDGDAWEANRQLLLFMKRYELSGFYNENKLRVSLLQRLLMKLSESEKDPDFIVSANGVPGTVTLEKAIREVNSGGLIRLLPGNYLGNIIIDRKLTLQGCSGVNIEDNMSLDTDRIKMSHLNFTKGYLELHRRVRDISISRLSFKKSGIKMRGENTSVVIENTLMRGLTVGECRQLVINNSVILDELEANSNKGFAIKGFISGQLNNTIVYSKTSFAMNMTERMDSSLSLKYCLIYGKLGLAQLSREKLSIIDLSSFARKVGRTLNSEIAEPQFISPETNDFGLKDFTPGFLAGEGKRSIGIQY